MTQQNTWLTDELTAKTTELGKLRQSSTEITCKLKSELAQKSEETAFLNVSIFLIILSFKYLIQTKSILCLLSKLYSVRKIA